jgi:biotin carboxyl carrier protein
VKFDLVSNGASHPIEVDESAEGVRIRVAGEPLEVDLAATGDEGAALVSLLLGGHSYEAQVRVEERKIVVELGPERFVFNVPDGGARSRRERSRAAGGSAEVRAPMPGKVVKLLVSPGDAVEAGQGLLLFEAMKMQNEIRAPLAGKVLQIVVREGQAVESRDLLVKLEG